MNWNHWEDEIESFLEIAILIGMILYFLLWTILLYLLVDLSFGSFDV